jgi:hypothetical protein
VITPGQDHSLWFTVHNSNAIGRAPACAPGLTASLANDTLTTNFDLGIAQPATWTITAGSTVLLKKEGPPAVPPKQFSLTFPFSSQGNVVVTSTLADTHGKTLCSEWTTVNTG